MSRRGVILAGGAGTRLYPSTSVTSKQLLPIYDKPMIYYPLTTLMLAGVTDVVLISTPSDLGRFESLLGTGSQWGISLTYREQSQPRGIAEALIIAADHIEGRPNALILGDNFFYGHGFRDILERADSREGGASIFAYQVGDPERYGVVAVDEEERPVALHEKPNPAPSNWAVTGLYFYDGDVVDVARSLKPSPRGELEITDVNRAYLDSGKLSAELLYRGFAWLDTGTHQSLQEASSFVQTVQTRQGLLIASPEEVAYRMGWITAEDLESLASTAPDSEYARYLRLVSSQGSSTAWRDV